MPVPLEYRYVVEALLKATRGGRVLWKEGATKDQFFVSINGGTLRISTGFDHRDDRPFIRLDVLNQEGKDADSWYVLEGEDFYEKAYELAGAARRKARNVETTLADLLARLGGNETIGSEDEDCPF